MNVDITKLGFLLTAFIHIYLKPSKHRNSVQVHLRKIPEVVRVRSLSCSSDFLVEVVCRDHMHLHSTLTLIQRISEVSKTCTYVSLLEYMNRNLLPEPQHTTTCVSELGNVDIF